MEENFTEATTWRQDTSSTQWFNRQIFVNNSHVNKATTYSATALSVKAVAKILARRPRPRANVIDWSSNL